ncbi:MAG: bifunctional 5,10-methylenetetrahydrofolate dehydrogenase/5,10-methenyltetrahydrofolate cyclohydrolase [Phycisphaerales bacterium]
MPAQIIDGKALAQQAREDLAARARALRDAGTPARLDAVLVAAGDNAARVYADNQARTCEAVGIDYHLHELPADTGQDALIETIERLNADDAVSSIMLHMPLPEGVDPYRIKERIGTAKDVEGVTPASIGNVVFGRSMRAPCTAVATLRLIQSTGTDVMGKRCVVVGAGPVVGRPIAVLLMQREATVVSCNEHTWGLPELCRTADILIPAAGVPGLITAQHVKPGALVVDVGVSRIKGPGGKRVTVGDCSFDEVREIAGWVSPVPGGVGPMTVTVLLSNVIEAAERGVRAEALG